MDVEENIKQIARKVIDLNKVDIESLCNTLHASVEDVIKAWVVWDTGINEYGNEIYSSDAMRVAMHLHNYIKGNWHDKRQEKVLDYIKELKPKSIVEVGFGTPQRYATEYVLNNDVKLNLLDFDQESLNFAKAFLDTKSDSWKSQIELRKYDMNSNEFIGDFDLYIFQDSIEHSEKPTEYLNKIVSQARKGSKFIFCIPIEVDKAIPEHNMFWRDTEHALNWIKESGLSIKKYNEIEMNPELDIFAKFLHKDFKEVLVLAELK